MSEQTITHEKRLILTVLIDHVVRYVDVHPADQPHFDSLYSEGLVTIKHGDWRSQDVYVITDAGRAALGKDGA